VFEQDDEALTRVVTHLKQPVGVDPAFDRRVMEAIAAVPPPRQGAPERVWHWLVTPRRVAVSPLGGLALAAAVAAVIVLRVWRPLSDAPLQPGATVTDAVSFQFVVVAPRAQRVSLVGDFNDWDPARTPMTASGPGGMWTIIVPLTPGRYRYAFLVDGTQWLADPSAPAGGSDGFGAPSSVVTVGGA
jgi:hypothetical protein